ncbi:anti-sigma factor [Solidesulfovibrio sp.]|uniref:anti-sigma factor family protein n=1 Tax=Solidesulfovibrio sp. TaxID=2910990 RepID=UPI00261AE3E1|nr:anti-sigma factor [Solidesulfovibrio sp.]
MSADRHRAVTIEELHAYVDGQLPRERVPEVEARLLADPLAAAQVRDYQAINAALRAALDPGLPEAGDTPSPRPALLPARRRAWLRMAMAAAFAGLLLGGAGGWLSRGYLRGDVPEMQALARHAAAAYQVFAPDVIHPVDMAESDRLTAWLSNRMNMDFPVPELSQAGFRLVGGRLMVGDGRPAGMLMYENGQGRRIVLYVRNDLPAGDPTRMRHESTAAGATVYWRDAAAGFALAGGFPEPELRSIANLIRARFTS